VEYLSSKQAADFLGLSVSRIRQLCISGELEGIKLGRDWLIDKERILKYIPMPRGRPKAKRERLIERPLDPPQDQGGEEKGF